MKSGRMRRRECTEIFVRKYKVIVTKDNIKMDLKKIYDERMWYVDSSG
jgi:hypothetical protein